jgi:hypothetical protein
MCRQLEGLRQSITEFAKGFDALALDPADARFVVRACAQMEGSLASVRSMAMARAADSNSWKDEGYRSAADQMAHENGTSASAARRDLETGRRLHEQPEVAEAARSGQLSADQTAAVASGAAAKPDAAQNLIAKAKDSTLNELHEEVSRVKADATDREARRKEIHVHRSFRRWTDLDGSLQGRLTGHPEDGVTLGRMLDPVRRRLNLLSRSRGEFEPLDALDYDALMTIASIAAGKDAALSFADLRELGLFPQLAADDPAPPAEESDAPRPRVRKLAGRPAKIIIRADLDTLLRGVVLEGERCEIDGYGPVPVSVIEDLLRFDNVFITTVLTRSKQVVGVYHHRRRPTAYQQTALEFLYPACAVKGCNTRAGLDMDHREDWTKTHFTVFDLMDRLCRFHHRLKSEKDWALVDGVGKRAFVAPADPRHPRHRERRHSAPP